MSNTINTDNNHDKENSKIKQVNEGISFDTFVDKVYTKNEILNFSAEKIREVRQYQIDKKNTSNLSIQKVAESASSENDAMRIASQLYTNSIDQVVRSSKIVLETDYYYIVKVEWDYITENTSKRNNQQILIFKKFYYDINSKIVNTDDINIVKDVLDLKYYIETYSNTGKNLIQSFIEKNGETTKYIIYYFDIEYGEVGESNIIYLAADTLNINSATGRIEDIKTEILTNGVRF